MVSNLIFLLFLVSLCRTTFTAEEVDKRLLVGDAQTDSSQLISLQREIQSLKTKIAEIDVHQSQIQFMNVQILQLQQDINAQKQENNAQMLQISQLQKDNNAQKLQISQLQQENNALKLQGFSHQEVQTLTGKMATLETKVNEVVEKNLHLHSGSTSFPIWGRKSCPAINGTETVYTGITGGKHISHSGSGTNTLCMPHDPDSLPSDFPTTTYSGRDAYLYGAEYQFTYKNVAIDDDVPCAICKVTPATTTMMVPAKLNCPQNWTLQYHGYLGASYYSDYASEFICIDNDPEYFETSRQLNSNGLLIYPVKTGCGSLPCSKYKDTQYLPCAVCTF